MRYEQSVVTCSATQVTAYQVPSDAIGLLVDMSASSLLPLGGADRTITVVLDGNVIWKDTVVAGKSTPCKLSNFLPLAALQVLQVQLEAGAGSDVSLRLGVRLVPLTEAGVSVPPNSEASAESWAARARLWAISDSIVNSEDSSAKVYAGASRVSAEAAEVSRQAAVDSANEAQEWAANPRNTEISTDPGNFSAYHWAQVARDNAQLASKLTGRLVLPTEFVSGKYTLQASDLRKIIEVDATGVTTPKIIVPAGLVTEAELSWLPLTIYLKSTGTLTIEADTTTAAGPPQPTTAVNNVINGANSVSGWTSSNPSRVWTGSFAFPAAALTGKCAGVVCISALFETAQAHTVAVRWRLTGTSTWNTSTSGGNNGHAGNYSGFWQGIFYFALADNYTPAPGFDIEVTFDTTITGFNVLAFACGKLPATLAGAITGIFGNVSAADSLSVPITAANQFVGILAMERPVANVPQGLSIISPGTKISEINTSDGPQGIKNPANNFINFNLVWATESNPPGVGGNRSYTLTWKSATGVRSAFAVRIDGNTTSLTSIDVLCPRAQPWQVTKDQCAWILYGNDGLRARLQIDNT